MADQKISALTGATTPLAGSEVLPIVQSSTTVKVSVDNLTAGRAISATSIATGLGLVGTPAYTFTGDLNSGMWSPAADTVAVSTAGAEALRITNAGNVGIGVIAPLSRLDVREANRADSTNIGNINAYTTTAQATGVGGTLVLGGLFNATDTAPFGGMRAGKENSTSGNYAGYVAFQTIPNGGSLAEKMRISSSGNVGIGTPTPAYQLQLSTDSAAKPTSALWTIASDSRIKTETGEYTKGLDAVCALRPITYQYNGAAGFTVGGEENISIIAQEAMQHFPECVGTFEALLNEGDKDKTELFNWNGHALIFALVNAIKELKTSNDALAARVYQLEGN